MNDELEGTWNKAIVSKFKTVSQHIVGGTEEKGE